MVVSYTTGYSNVEPYSFRDNKISTNADGGGNGGGAFLKMFNETESEDAKKTGDSSVDYVQDPLSTPAYYASESVIRDYIDNSLLLNTEQVACTNIAQHLALKSNVKETLKFLNTQAAKTMVNSRKRNYNFQTKTIESSKDITETNFFKTTPPTQNFFLTR